MGTINPGRHQLSVRLVTDWGEHQREVPFGRRDIAADGTQFVINGRPSFLRGTLESAIFPRTGHPPMEIDEWRRVLRAAQAHGLNHLRFHSWCPPEAAFQAADELGVYVQVETCWPNQSTTLGEGRPVDQWVRNETDRILKAADVLVTARFDDVAKARLDAGGTVLLTLPGDQVRNYDRYPVKLGFSSIFWNTAWSHRCLWV